jgi:alkanesulfonate monooxygenase SsuD/methylene tetrahydromethanopterin reductase-like flavin-dependent oxidoreductase (luciferase family)
VELCVGIEGQEDASWAEWKALAEACEANGIACLYGADHYLSTSRPNEWGSLDIWGTLCALGAVTSRLRLGSFVSPSSFRHPSVLAKLALTADHVSGGRIDLGMGAGWYEGEHRAFGLPFPDVKTRMDILEEQVAIVHGLLGPGPFSYSGAHYTYAGVNALPKPVRGHLPLLLGGNAGPRAARLAARWADEYNSPPVTPEEARLRRERLHAACEAVGRDPGTLRFSVLLWLLIGRDQDELYARARAVSAIQGRPDRDPAEVIAELRASGRYVVGTPDEAAEVLRAFGAAGADRVNLALTDHRDLDQVSLVGDQLAPMLA